MVSQTDRGATGEAEIGTNGGTGDCRARSLARPTEARRMSLRNRVRARGVGRAKRVGLFAFRLTLVYASPTPILSLPAFPQIDLKWMTTTCVVRGLGFSKLRREFPMSTIRSFSLLCSVALSLAISSAIVAQVSTR